jgi:hypothetical protein
LAFEGRSAKAFSIWENACFSRPRAALSAGPAQVFARLPYLLFTKNKNMTKWKVAATNEQ